MIFNSITGVNQMNSLISILELGSAPYNEECVQAGDCDNSTDDALAMIEQCKRFKKLLIKINGEPPEGSKFLIQRFSHDLGAYYEVVYKFNTNNEEHVRYSTACESNIPAKWVTL